MLHTDEAAGCGFGITAEAPDSAQTKAAPEAGFTAIETSLRKALSKARQEFRDSLAHLLTLPAFLEGRETLVRECRSKAQRVQDIQSILSRKHWQEFADPTEDRSLRFD